VIHRENSREAATNWSWRNLLRNLLPETQRADHEEDDAHAPQYCQVLPEVRQLRAAQDMRQSDPPMPYLVGTPKGALSALEKELLARPWETVRAGIQVKLLPQAGEVYVLAQSCGTSTCSSCQWRKRSRI